MINYDNLTEIELTVNNKNTFEYYTNSVPRNGELMEVSEGNIEGEFVVTEVKHKVVRLKDGKIITYAKVKVEDLVPNPNAKLEFPTDIAKHVNSIITDPKITLKEKEAYIDTLSKEDMMAIFKGMAACWVSKEE